MSLPGATMTRDPQPHRHPFKHAPGDAGPVAAFAAPSITRFYVAWAIACGLAELVGLAAAAGWWVTMDGLNPDPQSLGGMLGMVALKAFAGLVEGGVLGTIQAFVIRRRYPRIDAPAWMIVTILLAMAGWGLGSAIPIFGGFGPAGSLAEPSLQTLLLFTGLGGALVGAAFGAVQAAVLRRVAHRAGWWIAANAAGWAVALPLIYTAASRADAALGWAGLLRTGLLSGLSAGLLIGAVTGLAFWRMPPR